MHDRRDLHQVLSGHSDAEDGRAFLQTGEHLVLGDQRVFSPELVGGKDLGPSRGDVETDRSLGGSFDDDGVPAGLGQDPGKSAAAVAFEPDAGEGALGEGREPVGPVHGVGRDEAGSDGDHVPRGEGIDGRIQVLFQQPDPQDLSAQAEGSLGIQFIAMRTRGRQVDDQHSFHVRHLFVPPAGVTPPGVPWRYSPSRPGCAAPASR